ncbi:MAG: hypothetical protein WD401_00700 [Thermomicrobiaceae bacterium]
MTASEIDVRPIRVQDLIRLRSMRTDAIMPDLAQAPLGHRFADPLSVLPISRRARKSFVAFHGGRPAGLMDLIADPENHRWIFSRLLTCQHLSFDEHAGTRESVWSELVLQAIRAAGAARAKRIHAILDEDSAVLPVMQSAGFAEFAQDALLMAQLLPKLEPAGIVRRQDASDVWAIHQLYHQVTPRPVQYAEAFTSNYWGLSIPGQQAARGYVVEDGFEIIAHCRVTFGCEGPILHVMVRPDANELLAPVVRDVLNDLAPNAKRPVSIIVPDYLQEYTEALVGLGFDLQRRQTRLVKYTVVARRMQFSSLEEFAREVPERVAAGTPSMYLAPTAANDGSSKQEQDTQDWNGLS